MRVAAIQTVSTPDLAENLRRTAELLTVAQELADRELHAERTRVAGAVAGQEIDLSFLVIATAEERLAVACFHNHFSSFFQEGVFVNPCSPDNGNLQSFHR